MQDELRNKIRKKMAASQVIPPTPRRAAWGRHHRVAAKPALGEPQTDGSKEHRRSYLV